MIFQIVRPTKPLDGDLFKNLSILKRLNIWLTPNVEIPYMKKANQTYFYFNDNKRP